MRFDATKTAGGSEKKNMQVCVLRTVVDGVVATVIVF